MKHVVTNITRGRPRARLPVVPATLERALAAAARPPRVARAAAVGGARAAAAGVPWLAQVYGDGAIQLADAKEARPPVVCDDVSAAADALSKLVRTSDDVEVAVRAGIAAGAGIARALAADDHHDKTRVP